MNIDIVELSPSDWHILRDLRLAALADSPMSFDGDIDVESTHDEAHWRALLAEATWIGIREDDRFQGMVKIESASDDHRCDGWLSSWWIAPETRGRGITRRALDWIDGWARERGWRRIGLGAWADNERGIAIFTRLGFEHDGVIHAATRWVGRSYVLLFRDIPASDT